MSGWGTPLTRHDVDREPTPTVTTEEIFALHEDLNLSRAVFARTLRATTSAPWKIEHKAGRGARPKPFS